MGYALEMDVSVMIFIMSSMEIDKVIYFFIQGKVISSFPHSINDAKTSTEDGVGR